MQIVDNKATIRLNGQAVVENMALSSRPTVPRPLKICTWSGNTLTIELVKLTANPTPPAKEAVVHPIVP